MFALSACNVGHSAALLTPTALTRLIWKSFDRFLAGEAQGRRNLPQSIEKYAYVAYLVYGTRQNRF